MPKNDEPKNVRCSFCGLPQDNVKKIIDLRKNVIKLKIKFLII